MPFIPDEMPWWRSKIIVSAIVSLILKALVISGLSGDIAPDDQTQIIDLLMLVISGVADLVAIGSRVGQKHAPSITAGPTSGHSLMPVMMAFLLVPAFLSVSACASFPTSGPGAVADKTLMDEKIGGTVTLAYTAASLAGATAISTGTLPPAVVKRIAAADQKAFDIIMSIRKAYEAGNSLEYITAADKGRQAVAELLAAVRGESP